MYITNTHRLSDTDFRTGSDGTVAPPFTQPCFQRCTFVPYLVKTYFQPFLSNAAGGRSLASAGPFCGEEEKQERDWTDFNGLDFNGATVTSNRLISRADRI